MELDFDKEIDAILRQTAKKEAFAPVNGSNSAPHLDADSISAFAENALPVKTRTFYMEHLADCDRCRKILSNLITFGEGAEVSASSSVPEAVGAAVPWYRRLFIFPNLAYAMGSLVLVFGGILGFLVFQNSNRADNVQVSQIANRTPVPTDYAVQAPPSLANSNAASNVANSAVVPGAPNFQGSSIPEASPGLLPVTEEAKSGETAPAARAADSVAQEPVASTAARDDAEEKRKEDNNLSAVQNKPTDSAILRERSDQPTSGVPAPPPPPPPAKAAKPNNEYRFGTTKDADEKKAMAKTEGPASGRRQISGKTFNRTSGVWYDSAYQGQATKDVRRGTNDYRKLDAGLRSIADSLGGVVIVVWRDGAYRIQ